MSLGLSFNFRSNQSVSASENRFFDLSKSFQELGTSSFGIRASDSATGDRIGICVEAVIFRVSCESCRTTV